MSSTPGRDVALAITMASPEPGNFAVLLTPPGAAAIAVVRLAGPAVAAFLGRHLSSRPAPGRCVHGTLSDGPRVIDDPVVVLAPQGDWADVNLHGGPWVVRSMLELAGREGFQIEPDPLASVTAFADATDPLEAGVLAALALARTDAVVQLLLGQSDAWGAVASLSAQGQSIEHTLRAALADRSIDHLLHPPRVALVGEPNVGKSTLANRLFASEKSITADLPGTTRDWVGGLADVGGLTVMLLDTPGLRPAADAIEHQAIALASQQAALADAIVLVLDATRLDAPPARPMLSQWPGAIVVANKIDAADPTVSLPSSAIPISARRGDGLDPLKLAIRRHFQCADLSPDRPLCWTDRQRTIVEQAIADPHALAQLWTARRS